MKETSNIFYPTQWLEYFFHFVHGDNIINETSKTWHTLILACFYLIEELLNLTMHTNWKASNKTLNNLHIYSALWNFTELNFSVYSLPHYSASETVLLCCTK